MALELAPPPEACDRRAGVAGDPVVQRAIALFNDLRESTADAAPSIVAQAELDAAWHQVSVVSFDIFDTLLVRKTGTPRDLFLHLKALPPYSALPADAVTIANARVQAEDVARTAALRMRNSVEVTLAEICSVLAPHFGLTLEAVGAMVAAEQSLELALCTAHAHVPAWYRRAITEGKRVWCVSDTYHSADFLRELLERCGLQTDGIGIISSADELCNKSSGALYRLLLQRSGGSASDVLHIGDNAQSDGAMARTRGLHAVVHPWAGWRHDDHPSQTAGDSVARGLSQIAARTMDPPAPFWYRFGYSVAGPMLSGFALWLQRVFTEDRIDRAYFLLRDGEILSRVYDALIPAETGPTTALLESSRRAFLLPALEANRTVLTMQLLATEDPRPVREFVERLGIRSADVIAAFRSVGFRSPDDVVSPDDSEAMRKVAALFAHPAVAQRLIARSREERALMVEYLRGAGVFAPGRVALVDVGWNGTIQKSIAAVKELTKTPTEILGYYIGTGSRARDGLGGDVMRGYLFEFEQPAARWQRVFVLSQLVEFICSAPRGSLRGFAKREGRVVPVNAPLDHSGAQLDALAQLHEGAAAYAADLRRERDVLGCGEITPDAALHAFARVLLDPTAEEAAHIGDLQHGDGLGTDRVRSLAAFRDDSWTVPAIRTDLARALWPTGLRARRDPRTLLLRSLEWMERAAPAAVESAGGDRT